MTSHTSFTNIRESAPGKISDIAKVDWKAKKGDPEVLTTFVVELYAYSKKGAELKAQMSPIITYCGRFGCYQWPTFE